MLNFTIYGEPVAKGRPRVTRDGHAFTPQKTISYEQSVKQAFVTKYPDHIPFDKDMTLAVEMTAYFPIPKSVSKKKREQMEKECYYHTKRPDADNIAKIILDALNGLCFDDDSSVCSLKVVKKYSSIPRVEVEICPLAVCEGF